MKMPYFFLALVALAGGAPARAVDLSKIERTLAKEPAYQATPRYCLLVFGPEAKVRAWLVVAGKVLYVDRNCNGDLTGAGKQVDFTKVANGGPQDNPRVAAGDITEPDGKTKHTGLKVGRYVNMNVSIQVADKLRWYAGSDSNDLVFAERPQDAPIIHFGGPLTLAFESAEAVAGKKFSLGGFIGTPGLGKSTFARIKAAEMPEGASARAEIELPCPKGEKPLVLTVPLKPDD